MAKPKNPTVNSTIPNGTPIKKPTSKTPKPASAVSITRDSRHIVRRGPGYAATPQLRQALERGQRRRPRQSRKEIGERGFRNVEVGGEDALFAEGRRPGRG